MNRQQRSIDPLDGESYFVFDEAGNTTLQANPRQVAAAFTYEKAGRQKETADALGGTT